MERVFWMLASGAECTEIVLMTPLGYALAILAIGCGVVAATRRAWPPHTWLFLGWPVIMCAVVSLWGHFHWADSATPALKHPELLLNSWLGIHFLGSLVLIYFHKSGRPATACVLALGSFWVLGCAFVAGMAVTASWL